ncbi:Uncharacterised protein [Mycobacteroides abscessus]|nr:Uncharacterised protein [Mycobacteroides abscessus]
MDRRESSTAVSTPHAPTCPCPVRAAAVVPCPVGAPARVTCCR